MIQSYELKKVKVSDVKFDPANPNKMSEDQIQALRFSLKKFGQLKPVIVDQTLTVCDGEHQVRAYMAEGVEEISVIQVECTVAQRRLIRQTMNKLHGLHDLTLDAEELKALLEEKLLPELSALLAQPEKDLLAVIDMLNEGKEENFDTKKALENPKYKIERGELWQLGPHRLLCGDSTNALDVSKLMGGAVADMVFTDPPFNIGYKSEGKNKEKWSKSYGPDNKKVEDYKEFLFKAYTNFKNNLKKNGVFYTWSSWNSYMHNWEALCRIGLGPRACIIWDKGNPGMGGEFKHQYELANLGINGEDELEGEAEFIFYGYRSEQPGHVFNKKVDITRTDLWKVKRDPTVMYAHPTQKPAELAVRGIKMSSVKGDLILDLFGGSGSTLIGAEQTGRRAFLMELAPEFCSVIIERWEKYSGQKGVKL